MERSGDLDQEYAEDVTDLREAQRLIAQLRRALEQRSELTYYADGEFTIFLDDRHSEMLIGLFEQHRLVPGQSPACELHDALSDFVSHWLDIQSKTQQHAQEPFQYQPHTITPTA